MIEYLKGEIAELTPATAIIECCGVGYETSITLNTYSALQGKKDTKNATNAIGTGIVVTLISALALMAKMDMSNMDNAITDIFFIY